MICKTCRIDLGLAPESWHFRAKKIAEKICGYAVDNTLARIAYKKELTEDDLIYIKENYANDRTFRAEFARMARFSKK